MFRPAAVGVQMNASTHLEVVRQINLLVCINLQETYVFAQLLSNLSIASFLQYAVK